MSGLHYCYRFGPSIKCSCDNRGRPASCLPVMDFSIGHGVGSNSYTGGDVWDMGRWIEEVFEKEKVFKKMETKVILAFTLLVMILLTFVG